MSKGAHSSIHLGFDAFDVASVPSIDWLESLCYRSPVKSYAHQDLPLKRIKKLAAQFSDADRSLDSTP